MARNIRQQWHRAERLGRVAVRHEQSNTLESTLDALFRLHAKRWNAKGSPGVLADPQIRDFHCHAAEGLLCAGLLRLHSLWIGAEVAAVYYGFHTSSRDYFYIGGFDPSFSSIGAGSLTIAAAIDRAIAERSLAFDFLGGREPYNYEWGAVDRARVTRHLQRREPEQV
jgi:Protein involved in cellulose biosynthesis (CelD)